MSNSTLDWKRAARIGLTIGLLQVAINQGDRWLGDQIDAATVLKSILSPLLTFSVALLSSRRPAQLPSASSPTINHIDT